MLTNISHQPKFQPKGRGFIVDKASGQPLPGVVIQATAELGTADSTVELSIPLGLLVSDAAGYVSFDLKYLQELAKHLKHLWIGAVGDEAAKIDLVVSYGGDTDKNDLKSAIQPAELHPSVHLGLPFWLKVDARLATQSNRLINLPSIQNPDPCDWELSPYSFTTKSDTILGEAGCEVPVPSTEVEREYRFSQVVRTTMPAPPLDVGFKAYDTGGALSTTLGGQSRSGASSLLIAPVDPTVISTPATMPIMQGEVLEFSQTWIPKTHSLGAIIYSLALAPCESVNIAVIDWSRKDNIMRTDTIVSNEGLFHSQTRARTIEEAIDAAINESQGGWSLMGGHGGAAAATVPINGVPVHFGGTLAFGGGISKSWGNRDLTAESGQELHDAIIQQTNVNRSLNSTVVVQATQDESNYLQTRTITNHNHCHALTIQYYEVLRHFKIVTQYVRSRRVVLVPYKLLKFDAEIALRYRTILESVLLDSELSSCFEAIFRLLYCPDVYTAQLAKPKDAADSKPSNTSSGSGATSEPTSASSGPKRVGQWRVSNQVVNTGIFVKKGSTVQVTAAGELDFGGAVLGVGAPVLNADGTSDSTPSDYPAPQLRKNSLICQIGSKWYQGGQNKTFIADEDGLLVLQPNDKDLSDNSRGWNVDVYVTSLAGSSTPSSTAQTSGIPNRVDDMCCEKRLRLHLNNNLGYYNRAIWLLQDPSERVMMLNAALSGNSELLSNMDTTPIAVSGNYVAFPYSSEPTKEELEKEKNRLAKNPLSESPVSIPTRGVFAETHLSHCNACEVRDVTRFWQWDEAPCEKPPTIEGITPGPRGQTPTIQPTTLPSPVVQIMQPPAAPDPVGLAAALNLLSQPNIFRDMSGMKELEDLLSGLASGAVDLAKGQQQLQALKEKLGAQQKMANSTQQSSGGGTTSLPSEPDAGKQIDKLKAIQYAKDQGLIDETQGQNAAEGVLGGGRPLLASADAGFVPDSGPLIPLAYPNTTDASVPHSIFCFYGHSGDGVRSGSFPDGVDRNLSFKLAAETVADTLRKVYTKDTVTVIQAWTKNKVFDALKGAALPIRQVHIFCHGDADWLSLAYHFDDDERILQRARAIDALGLSDNNKALEALKQEDAIVVGFLSRVLDSTTRSTIKTKHAAGASWQIWGCFSGYPMTVFTGSRDPELDKYFKRFNFGQKSLDGIAVEIAKTFGIMCTAAQGNGLEFWIGRSNGQIERSTTNAAPLKPFWMWLTGGATWNTFDATGALLSQPNLFGRNRDFKDLPTPKPPKWLTDGYYVAAPGVF